MTPYVIDRQKQLTIYLLFILGIIVSFGIGFVFGFQIGNLESAIQPSAVIEQSAEEEAAVKEDDRQVDEKKKEVDKSSSVDQKKTQKLTSSKQDKKQVRKAPVKKVAEIKPAKKTSEKKLAVVKTPPVVQQKKKPSVTAIQPPQKPANQTSSSSQLTQTDAANKDLAAKQLSKDNTSHSESANSSATADKKRYYSVQAGLFASRDNAVKFLDELLSNGFDAYMKDFVSSSGTVKYNVRFGRSESREETRQRLAEFRQAFSTPAYVVIGN